MSVREQLAAIRRALGRPQVAVAAAGIPIAAGIWFAAASLLFPSRDPARPLPAASFWNFWPSAVARQTLEPVPFLEPGREYRLTLDLSSLPYRAPRVTSRAVGEDFRKEVVRWLEQGRTEATMRVVLLYEPAYLQAIGSSVETLRIDLQRMRQAPSVAEDDPFKTAQHAEALPPFTFGRVGFMVRTSATEGPASVALSMWAEDRPVDELAATLCIARDQTVAKAKCGDMEAGRSLLKGIDAVRVAAEPSSPHPDAALHFVELDRRIFGVLWRAKFDPDRFISWPLDHDVTPAKLREFLAGSLMPAIARAPNDDALRDLGRALYNRLFPIRESAPQAQAARAAFEEFVAAHRRIDPPPALGDGVPISRSLVPSIFVRMVLPSLDSALMLPAGFMTVKENFVGYSFRIESPLASQTYAPHAGCISQWVMVVPPEGSTDRELKAARTAIESRIAAWQPVYTEMKPVRRWLQRPPGGDPLALFVTSHHSRDTLYFDRADPLLPAQFENDFARPSIAILNGCGTGELGASDFIAELSKRGFAAVIATGTEVKGEVAGKYLGCLADVVEANKGSPTISLSEVHFAAVQCLRTSTGTEVVGPYGGRALAYMLLGNGSVRLCPPRRREP